MQKLLILLFAAFVFQEEMAEIYSLNDSTSHPQNNPTEPELTQNFKSINASNTNAQTLANIFLQRLSILEGKINQLHRKICLAQPNAKQQSNKQPSVGSWTVDFNANSALSAGAEPNIGTAYVCRAYALNGDIIVGKIFEGFKGCYYAQEGAQHLSNITSWYEVFSASPSQYDWVTIKNGAIPEDAIVGGFTFPNETSYICRWVVKETGKPEAFLPGNLIPSSGKCSISYGGKAYLSSMYHVLAPSHFRKAIVPLEAIASQTRNIALSATESGTKIHHGSWTIKFVPSNAVPAGIEPSVGTPYICRALTPDREHIIGKIFSASQGCLYAQNGTEQQVNENGSYDVLSYSSKYTWVLQSHGDIPEGAVQGGLTKTNEISFVCRSLVITVSGQQALLPGNLVPSSGKCTVSTSTDHKALSDSTYEVLAHR